MPRAGIFARGGTSSSAKATNTCLTCCLSTSVT